jgi:hypothetical protein
MAFLFASASSQYLSAASAPVTVEPLTMSLWFRPTSLIDGQCLLTLGASAGVARYQMSANASTGSVLVIKTADGGTQGISTNTASFTVGQWMHIAAVFSSTTNRIGYINGVAGTANTTSVTTATPDRIVVGARLNTGFSQYTNGDIAEVGVYNAILTPDEIDGLAKGYKCSDIRPQALRFDLRMIRNLQDLSQALAMTNTNGATVSTHPRIIYS